jgi:hypothetical protein
MWTKIQEDRGFVWRKIWIYQVYAGTGCFVQSNFRKNLVDKGQRLKQD